MNGKATYLALAISLVLSFNSAVAAERRISLEEYRDKVRAAWIGKMAGVGWGITTEFRYSHRIVPDSLMYGWSEGMINEGFNQDDIYLSAFALSLINDYGPGLDSRTVVLRRQDVEFEYGRRNSLVRNEGIAPPDLGHPFYKHTSDGCGYTCGADFSGLVAPGLPSAAMHFGEVFGSCTGYGDGIYGGILLGSMYCEAFFSDDIISVVKKGLESIPPQSLVRQAVSDVLRWYLADGNDWKATWRRIMDKYWWNEENNWTSWPYGGCLKGINLDSKSMCAFTVMALLYGNGNLERTMRIAVQASEDADCDASIAAGILCAMKGMTAIDKKFHSALDVGMKVKYLPYTFDELVSLTEKVARAVVPQWGGRIEEKGGREYFIIPNKAARVEPGEYLSSKEPGPLTGSRFTSEEIDCLDLVSDPGFETQSGAWSFFLDNRANHILPVRFESEIECGDSKESRTGLANACISLWYKNAYRNSGSKLFAGIRQIACVEPGCSYKLGCWVRNEGGASFVNRCKLRVRSLDGRTMKEVTFGDKKDWTKVALQFDSFSEAAVVIEAGFIGVNDVEMICRFDDFSMKKQNVE